MDRKQWNRVESLDRERRDAVERAVNGAAVRLLDLFDADPARRLSIDAAREIAHAVDSALHRAEEPAAAATPSVAFLDAVEVINEAGKVAGTFVKYNPHLAHLKEEFEDVSLVADLSGCSDSRDRMRAMSKRLRQFVKEHQFGSTRSLDAPLNEHGFTLHDLVEAR